MSTWRSTGGEWASAIHPPLFLASHAWLHFQPQHLHLPGQQFHCHLTIAHAQIDLRDTKEITRRCTDDLQDGAANRGALWLIAGVEQPHDDPAIVGWLDVQR
jgi:hypothetical protein